MPALRGGGGGGITRILSNVATASCHTLFPSSSGYRFHPPLLSPMYLLTIQKKWELCELCGYQIKMAAQANVSHDRVSLSRWWKKSKVGWQKFTVTILLSIPQSYFLAAFSFGFTGTVTK